MALQLPVGTVLPAAILAAVRSVGLLTDAETPSGVPLTGGVSSDIWRVDLAAGPVCVKRALPKLRVAADWHAPVGRSLFEARWMRHASYAVPGCAPTLLGEAEGCIVMQYLSPDRHALWKTELAHGRADEAFAGRVGSALVRIHAATAAEPGLARDFESAEIFHAIRLDPYLLATARAHPDLAGTLRNLVSLTAARLVAMVHGDVSPKNILAGPAGPVFLDAECATWGDPAFDLAFCLTHLLLKTVWRPAARTALLASFAALAAAHLAGVTWEPPEDLEARAAALLPALLLARVDGKSPVEYITRDADRDSLRRIARALLASPVVRLAEIRTLWERGHG